MLRVRQSNARGNQMPFMTKNLSKILRKDHGYAMNI